MRRFTVAVMLALAASAVALAQEAPAQPATTTVQGCLQQAGDPPSFTLTTSDKQAYGVVAAEGVSLVEHINHQVALTGTVAKSESGAVLTATALEMLAATCTP